MSRSLESFVPRRTFTVPQPHSFTWFPGHMLTGLRSLASTISDIDLIIETRDARIPLSSRNPYLYDVCGNKRRLVLYNKHDLAGLSRRETEMILSWHTRPEEVVFTNVQNQHDIRKLVSKMRDVAEELNRPEGMKSIIIGMPNTGKSTMLNVIRNIATERKGLLSYLQVLISR
jgi:mitochondrial GTPase 1